MEYSDLKILCVSRAPIYRWRYDYTSVFRLRFLLRSYVIAKTGGVSALAFLGLFYRVSSLGMTQVNVFYTVLSLVGVKKVPMVTRGSSKTRTLSHVGGTPVNL